MNRILLIVALVLAFIAALLGFDIISTNGDPHLLGWVAASLVAYFGSLLA